MRLLCYFFVKSKNVDKLLSGLLIFKCSQESLRVLGKIEVVYCFSVGIAALFFAPRAQFVTNDRFMEKN